jgi:hypothetical protein
MRAAVMQRGGSPCLGRSAKPPMADRNAAAPHMQQCVRPNRFEFADHVVSGASSFGGTVMPSASYAHVGHAGDRPHGRPLAEHREDLDTLGYRELVHACLSSSIKAQFARTEKAREPKLRGLFIFSRRLWIQVALSSRIRSCPSPRFGHRRRVAKKRIRSLLPRSARG